MVGNMWCRKRDKMQVCLKAASVRRGIKEGRLGSAVLNVSPTEGDICGKA